MTLQTQPPVARAPSTRGRLAERLAYTGVAVGASVAVTAVFSWVLNGAVLASFLVTGFGCSLIVSWFMTGQVQRAQEAELAASLKEVRLRAQRQQLEAVRSVLREVNHHVNNLANNLQLVDLEYTRSARLEPRTLDQLKIAIESTTQAIRTLNDTTREDPPRDPSVRPPPAG